MGDGRNGRRGRKGRSDEGLGGGEPRPVSRVRERTRIQGSTRSQEETMSDAKKMVNMVKTQIGKEEINAVVEVLKSGMLAQGPKVAEFEKAFAEYIGDSVD